MVIRALIFIGATLAMSSCVLFKGEDDLLEFTREPVPENVIQLNGYYYLDGNPQGDWRNFFFIYRNGVILNMGSAPLGKSSWLLNDAEVLRRVKNSKTSWGVLHIAGDSIQFEKWYHSGGGSKVTYLRKGVILNDSTFVITGISKPNGKEYSKTNELYHFRKFSPKPDSTNQFIP